MENMNKVHPRFADVIARLKEVAENIKGPEKEVVLDTLKKLVEASKEPEKWKNISWWGNDNNLDYNNGAMQWDTKPSISYGVSFIEIDGKVSPSCVSVLNQYMPEKARNLRMIMDNLLNPQSKASIGDLIKQAEQLMGEKIPSAVSPDKSARNAVDYISKYLVRPGVSERCIDSQQIMLDTRGNNGLGDNSLVIMENHDRVLKEGDENRIVITTESTSSRTYIDNDGKTNRLEVSKARSSGPVKKYSENKYVAEINPKSNKLDVLSENTAQEHFENEPKVISKKALEISVPEGGLNKKTLVEALSKHNELENENVDAKEPGAM